MPDMRIFKFQRPKLKPAVVVVMAADEVEASKLVNEVFGTSEEMYIDREYFPQDQQPSVLLAGSHNWVM